eukprot:g3588.t1
MVSHLVATHAAKMGTRTKKSHYEFNVRESNRMVDQQAVSGADYMTHGTVAANDYGGKVTNINEMLEQNKKRIGQEVQDVASRHEDDMAFLTKERDDALAAALDKYTKREAYLQGRVDFAQKEFDDAFAARAAQEEIRNTARADYDMKQGKLDAAKALQAANMTSETKIHEDTDAATLAHFTEWMQHYDDEEKLAHGIIAQEQKILGDVRSILSGTGLGAAAQASVKVNKCVAEKAKYDEEITKTIGAADKCTLASALEKGNKAFDKNACPAMAEQKKNCNAAKDTYEACLGTSSSSLVVTALIQTHQMAKKYINADKYNEATAGDIDEALKVLDQLDATLVDEDNKVTAGAKKDRENETQLRADKEAAAQARWDAAKAFHIAAVAKATGIRNAARAEWQKQYDEWQRLLDIQNTKSDKLKSEKAFYVAEEKIAAEIHEQEDAQAHKRFADEKLKVDDIKSNDTLYLKSEIDAITELQGLVAKLNEKGL